VRANHLHAMLVEGRTATCGWVSSDSRYIAEVLSHAGYDAVTIDLQHGMFGMDTAVHLLQAVAAGPATPLARCSTLDEAVIGKLLDAGAYGIICPDVHDAGTCERLVAACRYPPQGRRSFGPARGLLYGGADYVEHADETVLVWAMIESRAAIDHLGDILAVDGLDGVYLGPNDLSLSLGERPGSGGPSPRVLQVISDVSAAARAAGRFVGAFAPTVESARDMVAAGVQLVTPGNDVHLLKAAVAERLAALHDGEGV
jgi:4-hydroxy-2-oxoheptanedioate aldolase